MIERLSTLDRETLGAFDEVIDVRTPAEFADDHVPGAVNLPVLSNGERADVGTMWATQSKFAARKRGAALIARNVADFLEGPLAGKGGGWRPLIYCWRGGQRSGAIAQILSEVGWRVGVVHGGYRSYRRQVVAGLYEAPLPHRLFVVTGGTGAGKTDLLQRLPAHGLQVLDLEALARHRGSLFGGHAGEAQPTQKMFESALSEALAALSQERPVAVEDESSRIGDLFLPSSLWAALVRAPRLVLEAPVPARARHVVRRYADVAADPAAAARAIDALPRHHGRADKARWRALLDAGDLVTLAEELITAHYDPAYARNAMGGPAPIAAIRLEDLGDPALEAAAEQAARLIAQADAGGPGPSPRP